MTERGRWGLAWLGWATAFGVLEAKAVRSGEADAPLSAHLRYVLGVHKRSKLGFAAFAGFFGWLGLHLWKQG